MKVQAVILTAAAGHPASSPWILAAFIVIAVAWCVFLGAKVALGNRRRRR
jgi:hypothetical protein